MMTPAEITSAINHWTAVNTPDGLGRILSYAPIPETPCVSIEVQLFDGEIRRYAQDRVTLVKARNPFADEDDFVLRSEW